MRLSLVFVAQIFIFELSGIASSMYTTNIYAQVFRASDMDTHECGKR